MISKKFLQVALLIVTSVLIGVGIFYLSVTQTQRMAEVFQQGIYASASVKPPPCTNCSYTCHPTGCSGRGSCELSNLKCGVVGGQCIATDWFCTPKCPSGCQEVQSGETCTVRCSNCTNEQKCYCPPPSYPPESPSPPPSSPPQNLVCSSLTRTPTTAPHVGSNLIFTCIGQPTNVTINHYEYRLSNNGGSTFTQLPNNTYTVPGPGNYVIQCRVCSSAGSTQCTTWGQAGGWTPLGPPPR
jgi:hypothetical protein